MARHNKNTHKKERSRKSTAGGGSRWRKVFRVVGVLGLFGFAAGTLTLAYFCYDLPDVSHVKPLEEKPSIVILAEDGTLVARYGGLKGDVIPVEKLPKNLVAAVLSIEDRRFYSHFGVDVIGLGRAMFTNIKAGHWVQGGSTITQQLAKNLFLTPEKTIRRKVQEALMAVWIEQKYTKNEILTAYLNRVYFGSGAYGVDAAAKVYFGKPVKDISLWESAVLAGLLKAPSRFSPASNPKLARERAKTVIKAMEAAGYISDKKTKTTLKTAKIRLAGAQAGDLNHYFGDWVLDQIDNYVTDTDRDLVIKTTFSPKLQLIAEAKQKALFNQIKPAEKVTQAALVTLAPDGAVMAMTGGLDYTESQFNRATQAVRQPGSSFKPFVYLAALEAGYKPSDMILDAPFNSGGYRPDNYDGQYRGQVPLTFALANSLNTATVRLLDLVGVSHLVDVAERMGFTRPVKPELSAGLGADEVTLLELAGAYATIANGGYAVKPYAILSVKDKAGHELYAREEESHPHVFSSSDISALDSMLVQVVAQGTGQAAQLSRGHVAGKTGTTQNYRDAWFVGYTDHLVTGVWMGNDDNTSMKKVTGGKYPARLWHDYMSDAINVSVPVRLPIAGVAQYPVHAAPAASQEDAEGYNHPYATPTTQAAPAQNKGDFGSAFGNLINNLTEGNFEDAKGDNRPVYNH